VGIRDDKNPSEVTREPISPAAKAPRRKRTAAR
jgi:hypothetical protein